MDLVPRQRRRRNTKPFFQGFKAAEWPENSQNKAPQALIDENKRAWALVHRQEQAINQLSRAEGGGAMARHLLVVSWRLTRGLAIVGKAISPRQPLGSLPPPKWAREVQIPQVGTIPLSPHPAGGWAGFSRAIMVASPHLQVHYGGPDHFVLQWLMEDPETRIQLVWPEPQEIIACERAILQSASRILSNKGRVAMARYFTERLGLGDAEARDLVSAVLDSYRSMGQVDPDVERGLLLDRVERYYRRAVSNGLLREEGNALKLHAQLVGLTRELPQTDDPDDVDLLDVIRSVNKVEGPPVKAIPPPIEVNHD